jgi:mannose-6-phosphate isomerase-like protein (cupin superfamily)
VDPLIATVSTCQRQQAEWPRRCDPQVGVRAQLDGFYTHTTHRGLVPGAVAPLASIYVGGHLSFKVGLTSGMGNTYRQANDHEQKDHQMTVKDIGPEPQSFDLEQQTMENSNYRTVAWSGKYLQLTLMSIPEGQDIGLEMHPKTDQFLRLDAGQGRAQMGPTQDNLEFDQNVSDGWCILVPAGTWHNVTNIGNEPMQLYAIYAPAHHMPGKIHATAAIAAADNDDEPAGWSVRLRPHPSPSE